ncbi:ABC transporter substrate-binding protein [Streptomyces sp. S584]|uniref:ABC transporter substrate-binding protein n=1 Tax=Streptomyces sp. S584 TaxID=3096010 RepID=UPI002AFE42F0|nr:ABC transporter substrate-binding protein [Streptomyces sp. S584]
MIGTPGYLAPNRRRRGSPARPGTSSRPGACSRTRRPGAAPSAPGRRRGVLFRTVHEDPDLQDLPGELLGTVTACLAKDPADRPTAVQAAAHLAGSGEADRWAVPGLAALVAARSSAALTLPDPEPLPAVPDPPSAVPDPAPAGQPSRRRVLLAGGAGAVLPPGGSTAAWLANRRTGGPRAPGSRPTYTIGLHADLSGPGRAVGLAHQRGAQLAVAAHNARTGAAFRLALRTEDDGGSAEGALRVAGRVAASKEVLAVVGPTTDTVPEAVVTRYGDSRLALVVVAARSSAGVGITSSLCVIRPSDSTLPAGLLHYVVDVRPARRIHVIEDRAGPESSWLITNAFREAALTGATLTVPP